MNRRQAPLTEPERNALNRTVGRLRSILQAELRRELEGTYGIRSTGEPEDEARLALTREQVESRSDLIGLWRALGRRTDLLVREAAFTHANRLIAIRVAEALGLLPESIAHGRRSSGFRQLLEVAPLLGSDDDAGYWSYLQICGDELAHDIPRLFDPRNPLLTLRPPPAVIDSLVGLLGDDTLGEAHEDGSAWAAPDTLGWTYQFFNSDDERAEMRKQHPQPQDSRELAVRNQFFTPDYVVRFLTQNTLGRRLAEGGFRKLADELELLVNPTDREAVDIDLRNVRVLDPACGSGHFLLGAYDILERAWELRGVGPGEAAPAIVTSLYGIDIDARATQVAAAAVVFRARRHAADGVLPVPNIVCARAVPEGDAARAELLTSVDPSQRDFLAMVIDYLDRAPTLGSLLKVEDVLTSETARRAGYGGGSAVERDRRVHRQQASLVDAQVETSQISVDELVASVLDRAQEAADNVDSSAEERVLAADGGDALRLVEMLDQHYDVVLMNPPFGEPIPETKNYLKSSYPWIPTRDYNLFAAFVGRGLELCKPDGYVGAITSRAGMFLTTFQRWRKEVMLGNDLTVLADLGQKVMHEALVEAAAYVVRPGSTRHDRPATFIRLLREPPPLRPRALADACKRVRDGTPDDRVYSVAPSEFAAVPGSPMAYWMSPDIRRLFTDYPPLEGHGAEVRVGVQTGNDFRFVRAFWEVDPARIARSREETFDRKPWVPFAKGGEYSPFWSDIHLVVDYERNGERLRAFPGARPQNLQYFFRPGLTWPPRTNSGFGMRILPAGTAFAHKGCGAFPASDPFALLGWLRTRFVQGVIELSVSTADETSSGGQSRSYEVGVVQRLPWPGDEAVDVTAVSQIVHAAAAPDTRDETARRFVAPRVANSHEHLASLRRHLTVLELSDRVEQGVAKALDLDADALTFFDEEVGPHPLAYKTRRDIDDEIGRLYSQTIDVTIRELIERSGGSRAVANLTYVANRRLEVIAHGLKVSPISVAEVVEERGLTPPGERETWAIDLASYLVGCAFGRWDVRIGRDPSLAPAIDDDPFAPVPVCPPGMLVGPDGLPTTASPDGYPIPLTDHRVLVDEAGHPADLVTLAESAAAALVDDPTVMLQEACELLGATDLRTYLRRRFFKDHVSRYSRSRRKAPLYWPLTVPSRSWTVWLYAPTLSREAIYVAAAHAERRYQACEAEIRRLESAQLQASTPGAGQDPTAVRAITKRLDSERSLSEELRTLRKTLARVASTGWVPDLDDGIVVCAAPFADVLLDWPKDPADVRKQLRAGRLDWARADEWRELL